MTEVTAQPAEDSCLKKALVIESKLKELQEKCKTPANYKKLCAPTVNLELWHDLSKESKNRDLGFQEVQKLIVEAAQPRIQVFELTLKSRREKSKMDH